MQAFVPKHRRPKFELRLKILDLNNVPLVSGTSFVKWHLPSSTSAEHRGRTPKLAIKDHRVQWNYEKTLVVRLTVDKNGMLQESEVQMEVLQEFSFGVKRERIRLGHVRLNLAEYVDGSDGSGDEGISRRYLMRDSKINSTLRVCIASKQIDGDKNFFACGSPPLKSALVFSGIAGIISNEQSEDDDGHLNPMSFKTTETREGQDMYRRTLAASFAAQTGELPADQCVESIFAGGDGWRQDDGNPDSVSGDDQFKSRRSPAETSNPGSHSGRPAHGERGHRRSLFGSRFGGRPKSNTSLSIIHDDHQLDAAGISHMGHQTEDSRHHRPISAVAATAASFPWAVVGTTNGQGEVEEGEVSEDLRSWTIPLGDQRL